MRGVTQLDQLWSRRLKLAYQDRADVNPLQAKHKGSTSYTDGLEQKHPGYIRSLFRGAQRDLGNQATFIELAKQMNSLSIILDADHPDRPAARFNKTNLYRWFNQHAGRQNRQ